VGADGLAYEGGTDLVARGRRRILKEIIQEGLPIKRWITKGFWAVMDQGLFATSNFAINILLARWLTPYDYGAFGAAFAVFLFIGSLHQAAFQEPMLVFGPGKYRERLPEYLGALVYWHFAFSALSSVVLALGGLGFWWWGSGAVAVVLFALALTGPFSLLLWLMRRACYVRFEPRLAATGGAWYMILMLVTAYGLYWGDLLSAASGLGVMAVSSLAVSLWLAVRLNVKCPPLRGDGLVRESFRNHWQYGRWSLVNQGLNWIPLNIPYLILPIWGGLVAGASFKALMNLIMPVLQGVWALSTLFLPALVRARSKGYARFNSQVRLALIPLVLGPALCCVLLGLFHNRLISWLYAGQYTEYAYLLWLLGLCPVLVAVKLVVGNALRALERPDWLILSYVLPAVSALTLGMALVYYGGIAGSVLMLLISQALSAALAVVFYRRVRRAPETSRLWNVVPESGTG
jgi:O-antigen/teichoic acid export membrane protein